MISRGSFEQREVDESQTRRYAHRLTRRHPDPAAPRRPGTSDSYEEPRSAGDAWHYGAVDQPEISLESGAIGDGAGNAAPQVRAADIRL